MSIDFNTKYVRPAVSALILPGQSVCQLDAR